MVEHPVERGADLADLGVRVALGLRDPLAEVHLAGVQGEFGDTGGGGGHPAQGAGGDADEYVAGDTGGDETGCGDAHLDEDQGVDRVVDRLGRQGDVVGAVGPGDVPHEVGTEPRDVDGVRARGGHLVQGGLLLVVEGDGMVALEGTVVAGGSPGDDRPGDRAVGADLGGDGLRLRRPLDEACEPVPRPGVVHAPAGSHGPRQALAHLPHLPVQLLVQMRPQRHGRHRPDHRTHDGDQHHGSDDEPRPQGPRLSRSACARTRPSSPAHDTAGLIR